MKSWASSRANTPASSLSAAQTARDASKAKLTYGAFISFLQKLGVNPPSVRAYRFSIPIGKGTYFAVYQQRARPTDYRSLDLSITREPVFHRQSPSPNTYVAIKRLRIRDDTRNMDVSEQGQLQAICQEIQALVHPLLREHDGIVKLQAVIWENGPGAGNESGLPMWPALVMEYCDTTLEKYQLNRPPLDATQKAVVSSKIGSALDALHSANIFHGDLKTDNVLVKINEDGTICPKLADFGCSIIIREDNGETKYWVGGTELWCAPECPDYFTSIQQIEATDWYSFGLLMLSVEADGKNPFEELGVIDSGWTDGEKLAAARFMKETDCLPALLNDAILKFPSAVSANTKILANMLLHDPVERMRAMEVDLETIGDVSRNTLDYYQQSMNSDVHGQELDYLSQLLQTVGDANEESELSSIVDETDGFDPFSLLSYFNKENWVPDFMALSKIPQYGFLNKATSERLIDELVSSLNDDPSSPYPSRCEGCCLPSFLDNINLQLDADALLDLLQHEILSQADKHTCTKILGSKISPDELSYTASLYGGGTSDVSIRKWTAIHQLYLIAATGFMGSKDELKSCQILEAALTSGFTTGAVLLCLYAKHTGQTLHPVLRLRKALVQIVLFAAGIPSDPFRALKTIDLPLANITAQARSKVYNGSTASFQNIKFNTLNIRGEPDTLTGFSMHQSGAFLVQDEIFENSLLHLIAGSENTDISLIGYCIDVLGIDKDTRNIGGVTPLLMACRAGREKMISALLEKGASVTLDYPAGETPLHWLGLLSDPHRVLKEFIRRGADINAQITEPQLLTNYLGAAKLFVKGPPLFWAIAAGNERFIQALLQEGADLHTPSLTGLTTISFACRPREFNALPILAKHETFCVSADDATTILMQWTDMAMLSCFVTADDQEERLGFILSAAIPFASLKDLENFYRFLIPYAVSDCRAALVEIVLSAFSLSIANLPESSTELEEYSRHPLSNPTWVAHRLVHEATQTGDVDVLKCVLRWGGDAASLDGFDRSTLHTLTYSSDNAECVDILMSHGAESVLDMRLQIEGLTALTNAIACGNLNVASRLLEFTSSEERTRLLSSRSCQMVWSNISLLGHFIAWCAELGERPIQYLFSLVELQQNPDLVFIVDEINGRSALMMACGIKSDTTIYDTEPFIVARRKRTIQALLEKFPERRHLDWRDNNNNTALHWAAYIGCADVAVELMDAGADLNLVTHLAFTPLDMVCSLEIPEYLRTDLQHKGIQLKEFKRSRNIIYMELKKRGARRHHAMAMRYCRISWFHWNAVGTPTAVANEVLPFGARRKRPLASVSQRQRRDSDISLD